MTIKIGLFYRKKNPIPESKMKKVDSIQFERRQTKIKQDQLHTKFDHHPLLRSLQVTIHTNTNNLKTPKIKQTPNSRKKNIHFFYLLKREGESFAVKLAGRGVEMVTCAAKGTVLQRKGHVRGSDTHVEAVMLVLMLNRLLLLYQTAEELAPPLQLLLCSLHFLFFHRFTLSSLGD